jgi:hypothetical protein
MRLLRRDRCGTQRQSEQLYGAEEERLPVSGQRVATG